MDIKQYTDGKYIPISDLEQMGSSFVASTIEYRTAFTELIPINDFEFANIVESPNLIRRRYEKNIELKGLLKIETNTNDYILEIALMIIKGIDIEIISQSIRKTLIKKFKENKRDLTIITNYLTNNYKILIESNTDEIIYEIPELNVNDIKFIKQYNKINQHYSINEYINLNGSSYETGRKALEKMTNLKLYIKTKLGKKFVYKPTNKLISITKGGSYGN